MAEGPTPPPPSASIAGAGSSSAVPSPATQASASGSGSSSSKVAATAPAPPRAIPAGLRPLVYLGIPESVLRWKPKPPSRNVSIFLAVTTTLASLYVYDRRECNKIRQEYIDQVKHFGEEPLRPYEYPRHILVYGAKSPGDDDYDKSIRYFKRYVRPILVAGGLDWEMLNGRRHGGLGRELRERIYARRRQLAGLEPWGTLPSRPDGPIGPPTPDSKEAIYAQATLQGKFALTPQDQMQRELDGAVVLMGRPAYKEYMWGLQQGWLTRLPPLREDLNHAIAAKFEGDGAFDELPEMVEEAKRKSDEDAAARATQAEQTTSPPSQQLDTRPLDQMDEIERRNRMLAESADDDEGAPLPQSRVSTGARGSGMSSPFGGAATPSPQSSSPPPAAAPNVPESALAPPSQIPAQPPLVYVPFVNLTGWRQIPVRMVNFFNRRADVRAGGEVALAILNGNKSTAREMSVPEDAEEDDHTTAARGDLDWGVESERTYPPRFHSIPSNVDSAKEAYYNKELPQKLKDSRTYYRGLRELSATEKNDPPANEQELREGRLRREREWAWELQGHSILDALQPVAWDQRMRGSLRVFETPWLAQRRQEEAERRVRGE